MEMAALVSTILDKNKNPLQNNYQLSNKKTLKLEHNIFSMFIYIFMLCLYVHRQTDTLKPQTYKAVLIVGYKGLWIGPSIINSIGHTHNYVRIGS